MRRHGTGKRRTWRKLLGIDPNTQDAIMAELTLKQVTDSEVFSDLMAQLMSTTSIRFAPMALMTSAAVMKRSLSVAARR